MRILVDVRNRTDLLLDFFSLRTFKASPFARDRKVAKEEAKSREAAELAKENQV